MTIRRGFSACQHRATVTQQTADRFIHLKVRARPGSDAVLHMSRNEFNELSSCEVRMNQIRTANLIRIGSAIFPAWLSRE